MESNNKLSVLGKFLTPKLEKIFKLSEFFILPQVAFDPALGASVSAAYMVANSILSSRQYNKILTFLEEVKKSKIEERINPDKEEDVDIINYAVDKTLSAGKRSQIRAIVRILAAKTKNKISYSEAEDLMNIVSELSESEAMVLQKVHSELEQREINAIKYDDLKVADIPKDRMDYLLNRLVGKGLLKQDMALARSTLTMNNYEYSLTGIAKSIFCNLDYIASPRHIYEFEGKEFKNMSKLVCAVVKSYIDKNENVGYEELKEAFPDSWGKPGFGVVVEDIDKGKAKVNLIKFRNGEDVVWRFHTSKSFPEEGTLVLRDGSHIVVSNQWDFDGNFKTFLMGVTDRYKGYFNIVVK